MKTNKQRRADIKQKRLERARRLQAQIACSPSADHRPATPEQAQRQGDGVALADMAALIALNPHASYLPDHYVDLPFTCLQCGAHEVWTAKQQKWWYEVAGGSIYSRAGDCSACRRQRRVQRTQAKSASMLDQQIERLRALAQARPDAAARAELNAALASKWHGVRVVAIGVLGDWWGRYRSQDDLAHLKALAQTDAAGPGTWEYQAAKAACKAIAAHVDATDMAWALHWLVQEGVAGGFGAIVRAMPQHALVYALTAPDLRRAAHADAALAPRLLKVLCAASERAPGWEPLARHYMDSPLIGTRARQWLQWRLIRTHGADALLGCCS